MVETKSISPVRLQEHRNNICNKSKQTLESSLDGLDNNTALSSPEFQIQSHRVEHQQEVT